jgi:hypothetical protein
VHKERKKNGKIYIFVLENKKDQSFDQKIHDSSERAQDLMATL